MSESASALFLIADAGEFGSRGFILSVKRSHQGLSSHSRRDGVLVLLPPALHTCLCNVKYKICHRRIQKREYHHSNIRSDGSWI